MLVLASNSPRRKQLLALGGWDFRVWAAPVDERVEAGEAPADYVRRLAIEKAQAVARLLAAPLSETLVVSADTAVVDRLPAGDGAAKHVEILGKPADEAEAQAMLRRLRGRVHQVYTAVVVLSPSDGEILSDVCITDVPMRDYSDGEIMAYVASGDPLDKAGAYAIQHPGFRPVDNLNGCYANVMGLPVCHLARLLAVFGVAANKDLFVSCMETLGYPCEIFCQVLDLEAQSRGSCA
jgi:MAF protein